MSVDIQPCVSSYVDTVIRSRNLYAYTYSQQHHIHCDCSYLLSIHRYSANRKFPKSFGQPVALSKSLLGIGISQELVPEQYRSQYPDDVRPASIGSVTSSGASTIVRLAIRRCRHDNDVIGRTTCSERFRNAILDKFSCKIKKSI